MGFSLRKRKMAARINERGFPFVVQIAMPEDGFGLTLDTINAWHRYTKNKQRRARLQGVGRQKFGYWCFQSLEIAHRFRQRFGGEIVPATNSGRQKGDIGCALAVEKIRCGTDDRKLCDNT
jgi:hypothetical protein